MVTQVKFIDGTTVTVDEFNASKIKGKVLQNPNLHVVLNVEDITGREYIFPFSAVVFIAPAEEEIDAQEDGILEPGDDWSIDQIKQYVAMVDGVDASPAAPV